MKQDCIRAPIINKINLQQCKIHKAATEPGQPISIDPKCRCCNLPHKKRHLNFWFSQKQIFYLGPGMVLFFRYLLITLISVCIPMLIYSIAATIANINSQFTLNVNFSKTWIFRLSTVHSISNNSDLYMFLLGASAILLTIFIPVGVKFNLRVLQKIYSIQNNFFYPQPFAVLIKLEKAANYSQQIIRKTINQWFQIELKIAVRQVNQGFNAIQNIFFHFNFELYQQILRQISEYESLRQRQQQIVYSFQVDRNQENQHNKRSSVRYSSKKSEKSIEGRLNRVQILKQKIRNKQLEKTNKFIVVFKTYEYVELIKYKTQTYCFKNNLNKLVFPGENFAKVFNAPFPSQIQYKTQHLLYKQKKRCRRFISWIITIIVIILGTALQFGLLMAYEKIMENNQFQYGALIIAFGLYTISQICCLFSKIFVDYQYQPNRAQKDRSDSYHIIANNVFLKCISIYLVYSLTSLPVYSSVGLIQTLSWFIIIWGSLIIIRRLINLNTLFYFIQNSISQNSIADIKLDQKQTNKLFQSPQNMIQIHYAQITSFALTSFAFCSLAPFALFICTGVLLISFLIQKICFVDIYRQPHPSSEYLYLSIFYILWKTPIFLILGQFYLIFIMENLGFSTGSLVKIVLSIMLTCCVLSMFIPSCLFKFNIKSDLNYEQVKNKIVNCYSQFNPLYSVNASTQNAPKSAIRTIRTITKSDLLIEELNTMSKSLQFSLRQRLFNQRTPCIQQFGNRHQDSMYFEFDNKVVMPQKNRKKPKHKVPPIFKQTKKDSQLKLYEQQNKKERQLIRLTHLATQEQQQIKHKIKQAIRGSINKLN